MQHKSSLTLQEITLEKLDLATRMPDGIEFELKEARLAGMFTEDAIELDDIYDDHENDENH